MAPETTIEEAEICRRIKQLRSDRGFTLQDLAERTGLTKGYLSKVENSDSAPPISTLLRIARALGVSMAALLGEMEADTGAAIVRAADRPVLARDGTQYGYTYESLAPFSREGDIEPYVLSVPRKSKGVSMFQHGGHELVFVLEGRVLFEFGGDTAELGPGDSAFFDGSREHFYSAVGADHARLLVVISPR
jgi:transcriptional regulator with XRE-family HTH domain